MKGSFEKSYRKNKNYFGNKPSLLIKASGKYLTKGTALDLGCGEGKDSLYLSKKYKMTAIDISKTGIKNLREKAKKRRVKIKTKIKNITKFKIKKKYDLILSMNTLQFIEKDKLTKLIGNMKTKTRKGGLNIIQSFTEKNPYKKFPYLFKKNELKNIYSDWKIIHYSEKFTPFEKHGEGKRHRHHIVQIIAKNINTKS